VKPEIFIPDAFTPNGDGLNEIFKPTMAGLRSLTFFRIYNRWGQLLFETTQPNTGWNGKFKGDEQPNGAYVYTVQAIDYLGEIINKKGTFVLIR
jgi:gliding motility-associated-like protein